MLDVASNPKAVAQAMAHLLPRGFAWPREAASVQQRVVGGLAASLVELDQFTHSAYEQWLPEHTCSRAEEWEEALGLPDSCIGAISDPALRRQLMLQRLRGTIYPYADSSPGALGIIQQLADDFGYTSLVSYEREFSVDRDGIDDPLGVRGHVIVDMSSMCTAMAIDDDGVDHLLVECTKPPELLMCLLQRIVPARFQIDLILDGQPVALPPQATIVAIETNFLTPVATIVGIETNFQTPVATVAAIETNF